MAYELFDELSTCDLDEIAKEDLEKIIEDCQWELTRRDKVVKLEAISKFREAFTELIESGVKINFTYWSNYDCHNCTINVDDVDDFDFTY